MPKVKYDWNTIQREYETGSISKTELASRHGIDSDYFYKKSRAWKKGGVLNPSLAPESSQVAEISGNDSPECSTPDAVEVDLKDSISLFHVKLHTMIEKGNLTANPNNVANALKTLSEIGQEKPVDRAMTSVETIFNDATE